MKLRAILALFMLVVVLTLNPLDAAAGKGWCRSDPVVVIGGTTYTVEAWVDFGAGGYATNPDLFVFYHGNSSYQLVSQDNGVDGNGETVRNYASLLSGHIGVRVHVSTDHQYLMYVKVNGVVVETGSTLDTFSIVLA